MSVAIATAMLAARFKVNGAIETKSHSVDVTDDYNEILASDLDLIGWKEDRLDNIARKLGWLDDTTLIDFTDATIVTA